MNDTLKALTTKYPTPKQETEAMTLAIIKVETPQEGVCDAYVDIRYKDENKKEIQNTIRKLASKGVTVEFQYDELDPNKTAKDNEYIKKLQQAAEDVLNKKIEVRKTPGASDANIIAHHNIPVVEFGPIGYGRGHLAIKGEYVDIKGLEDYYEILKKFLLAYSDSPKQVPLGGDND
jgi:acetylornithine deacetylase/succinyl-diaminopimelate desuccinylase-like protein